MDETVFSHVVLESEEKKRSAGNYANKRYLYDEIKSVPQQYFVGVYGLRGIGKTILLLQLANETKDSLYFSADAAYLRNFGIYEIVKHAESRGYKNIFIDEVYYKEYWKDDIKTIYDEGGARVIFSGSSVLEIKEGVDLSRRVLLFNLKPLSFREYLVIKKGCGQIERIQPKDLFESEERKKHIIKYAKFSDHLVEYFKVGGLLYESGEISYFYKAVENTIERIIHHDLAYLREIDIKIEIAIQKILERIALSPVGETNYSNIANTLSLSKPTVIKIIDDLVKIGLVKRLLPCGKALIRKEPKLYLAFPFRYFFNTVNFKNPDIGSLREEFFVNHTQDICYLKGKRGEKMPDFVFEGKKVEIGGEGKRFYQHPDFLIKDGVSFEEKTIPLFLTGFLY